MVPTDIHFKKNRGWENRTPTKGFGDPYHTIWPIPYIIKLYIQNFIQIIRLSKFFNANILLDFLNSLMPTYSLRSYVALSRSHRDIWLSPRPISNSQLHVLPHFHLCPIYLVVFKGSYPLMWGISHLEGGFTLRCLQRLSLPDLATLPCRWSTTDTPVVRPSRSSRTKDSSSQISSARAG